MKQVFIDAKTLIEKHGHARGDEQALTSDRRHGYCIATALVKVAFHLDPEPIVDTFRKANGIDKTYQIGAWNDERTKDEVLAAFDKAIEAAP
jgi:hypothetical protein